MSDSGDSIKSPRVLIGIANHNRAEDLIECIRSLQMCTYPNVEILVLDNGSTDDSMERIRAAFPSIELIRSEENVGPAGARNILFGVARQKHPGYLLILDNDTVVDEGFIEPLVRAMEQEKDAAVAGGTILEYEHPERIWYGGGKLVPFRGLAVHKKKGKKFDRASLGPNRPVSFITSCMMIYRGSMLDRIGWQDERFFPRLEDHEYAVRLHRNGFKQLYVPESIIYHKVKGENESTFKLYYSVRNRLLLIRDGFGGLSGTIAAVYFLVVISCKLCVWRFCNISFFVAAKAGLVDYFAGRFGEGRGLRQFPDPRIVPRPND